MNGMKLGNNQRQKNSFAFENQFLNFDSSKNSSEEEQEDKDDDELYSESNNVESKKLSSRKPTPIVIKVKQEPFKKKQVEVVQKQVKNDNKVQNKVQNKVEIKKQIKKEQVDDRISNINKGISKLSVSIHEMKDNYEDLQLKQIELKKRNQKKQAEIKQFLVKKYEQKQSILERKKIQQERDKKKLQQSIRLQEEAKASRQKNKIEDHLRRLNQMRQRREAEKQKAAEQGKIVSQLFEKISSEQKKQKFHVRKMQEDKIKKQKQLQQMRSILVERKNAYKSIDVSELSDHQRRHQQALQELNDEKRVRRESYLQKIQQQNARFDNIHKSLFHEYIEEELQELKLKRKAPKEKNKKIKQYQHLVREKFLPKTHQPSGRKSLNKSLGYDRNSLSNRQVRRYRYLNGVAHGQIIQYKPKVMSDYQQKQVGNENLAYLRSLPKKKIVIRQEQLSPQDLAILDKKLNSIVKVKKQKDPLYERAVNRSTEVKISQNPTRDEINMVFQQLKSKEQQTKMKQKLMKYQDRNAEDISFRNKQINDDIVKNIEQKLNLLAKI